MLHLLWDIQHGEVWKQWLKMQVSCRKRELCEGEVDLQVDPCYAKYITVQSSKTQCFSAIMRLAVVLSNGDDKGNDM